MVQVTKFMITTSAMILAVKAFDQASAEEILAVESVDSISSYEKANEHLDLGFLGYFLSDAGNFFEQIMHPASLSFSADAEPSSVQSQFEKRAIKKASEDTDIPQSLKDILKSRRGSIRAALAAAKLDSNAKAGAKADANSDADVDAKAKVKGVANAAGKAVSDTAGKVSAEVDSRAKADANGKAHAKVPRDIEPSEFPYGEFPDLIGQLVQSEIQQSIEWSISSAIEGRRTVVAPQYGKSSSVSGFKQPSPTSVRSVPHMDIESVRNKVSHSVSSVKASVNSKVKHISPTPKPSARPDSFVYGYDFN